MLTSQVKNYKGENISLEHYGRIIRTPLGDVAGIVEFKDATDVQRKIKEVNPGIYMFNTKWLWENIKLIGNKNAQNEYYLTDIVQIALGQNEKINSILVPAKEVLGVNSQDDLAIAERILNLSA
jgi:bifunctional UDP-N-acetylglucosamine pyrophosphorylase/glucosamine-1-phosphate N-acetyltransferase